MKAKSKIQMILPIRTKQHSVVHPRPDKNKFVAWQKYQAFESQMMMGQEMVYFHEFAYTNSTLLQIHSHRQNFPETKRTFLFIYTTTSLTLCHFGGKFATCVKWHIGCKFATCVILSIFIPQNKQSSPNPV